MVLKALERLPAKFTVAQLEQASPGVSREMVRRVLGEQKGKTVECISRGPGARWSKKGTNSQKRVMIRVIRFYPYFEGTGRISAGKTICHHL
jgi:hypothetical protein